MNLDDWVLLRGWINHIEWAQLDSQLPEAGASSRKRIKDLRQQLVMKARFYGRPEQVAFWLGERGHTETWARRALTARNRLPHARGGVSYVQDSGSFVDYIWQFVDGRPRRTIPVKIPPIFLFVRIHAN